MWAPVRLRRVISKIRPGIVYSMLDLSNLMTRVATLSARYQPVLVWGIRASDRQADYRAAVPYWLCKILSKGIPFFIANSQAGLLTHRQDGFRIRKGVVVHNGFDLDRFYYDPTGREKLRRTWEVRADEVLVGIIGRLDPIKGHEVFIRMVARLKTEHAQFKFISIGPGPASYKSKLEGLVQQLDVGDRMRFYDGSADLNGVYSALDVVVSTSISEGFSNVIGEAMACRRACVVSNVGDSAILVGDCGIAVKSGDDAAFAEAVMAAMENRDEMGWCGRSRIENEFTANLMVSRTIEKLEVALRASEDPGQVGHRT